MKDILEYSINDILKKIYSKLIDYHYDIVQEFQYVGDIEDEKEMVELITEMLDKEFGVNEQYNHLIAGIIYIKAKDNLISEIMQRDLDAEEAYNDKMFDYNSITLPR